MDNILYVITGPTASGKTSKAVALAKAVGGEIISADSRQIYQGMDIGTGKDLNEYGDVPYHLIDICKAGYKYNLYEYLRDYNESYQDILTRGRNAILCGGTGLYVESVLKGIQLPQVPENKNLRLSLQGKSIEELTAILKQYKTLHNVTDVDSTKRAIRAIEIEQYYHENPNLEIKTEPHPLDNALIIGVDIDRESRRRRITERLKARLEDGMVSEIETLIKDKGVNPEDLIYYGLEYKFITQYVIGKLSYDEMVESLEIAIHQFAKRQMTWFRGMERRGFKINWIPYNVSDTEFVERALEAALIYFR
ncbi:MAG: tRNA (adenosine(37)-N6)-dimethylallyltransferase MiaA [Muribaculaceae bacterium]